MSATSEVQQWLNSLDGALSKGDAKSVASLFEEEGFWRDLISFTWNIKTMEGRSEIEKMISACKHVNPSNWAIEEEPTSADGITESWLTFETGVGRGRGQFCRRSRT